MYHYKLQENYKRKEQGDLMTGRFYREEFQLDFERQVRIRQVKTGMQRIPGRRRSIQYFSVRRSLACEKNRVGGRMVRCGLDHEVPCLKNLLFNAEFHGNQSGQWDLICSYMMVGFYKSSTQIYSMLYKSGSKCSWNLGSIYIFMTKCLS